LLKLRHRHRHRKLLLRPLTLLLLPLTLLLRPLTLLLLPLTLLLRLPLLPSNFWHSNEKTGLRAGFFTSVETG
jgi:hypothetical protein